MKFSILIPAYKSQFLADCIESVIAQTYQDWELIIVNDASPYDMDLVVRRFSDKRLRYYTNEKSYGAVEMVRQWNHCLEYATGEYVINMGDDDKLTPTCLENYARLIKQHPDIDVFHTRTEIINENSELVDIQEVRPERESVYSMMFHYWKGRRQMMGDWLLKTSALREMDGYYYLPCAWGSDDITPFLLSVKRGVVNTNDIGFVYRNHSQTVSNNVKLAFEKVEGWHMAAKWYMDFLKDQPCDPTDVVYWKILRRTIPEKIEKLEYYMIKRSIENSLSRTNKWLTLCENYDIPRGAVLMICFHALIDKTVATALKLRFWKRLSKEQMMS